MASEKQVCARVEIVILNNAWWVDAFQFGVTGDTSWSFAGVTFLLDVKVNATDAIALLALNTGNGTIITSDIVQRILQMNVNDHAIRSALPAGDYVYDLIMVTTATGQRDPLMAGPLHVVVGPTVED